MPNNASFGCFPSISAINSASQGDLQKAYFSSSYRDYHSWRTLDEAGKWENMDAIHSMGKKTTKYMKFQANKAPLVDRTACTSFSEYVAKPLGDCACNRQLAENFKGGNMSKTSSTPNFGTKSNYGEAFVPITTKQLRGAKQKSRAPTRVKTQTLGGTGDTLVLTSNSHHHHAAPPMGFPTVAAMKPKPNLTLSGHPAGDMMKTQYSRDFDRSRAQRSRQMEPDEYLPPPNMALTSDSDIFQTRRMCFMSPGQ